MYSTIEAEMKGIGTEKLYGVKRKKREFIFKKYFNPEGKTS